MWAVHITGSMCVTGGVIQGLSTRPATHCGGATRHITEPWRRLGNYDGTSARLCRTHAAVWNNWNRSTLFFLWSEVNKGDRDGTSYGEVQFGVTLRSRCDNRAHSGSRSSAHQRNCKFVQILTVMRIKLRLGTRLNLFTLQDCIHSSSAVRPMRSVSLLPRRNPPAVSTCVINVPATTWQRKTRTTELTRGPETWRSATELQTGSSELRGCTGN
jgi:hypothetical protein